MISFPLLPCSTFPPSRSLALALVLFLSVAVLCAPKLAEAKKEKTEAQSCVPIGQWWIPDDGKRIEETDLLDNMSKRPVVMLGESHTSAEHHRWQLHVLSALYGRNPNMVMGFEAFPRTMQPVLDRWTRGELNKEEFLKLSRWYDVWRFDPNLYMPLFHFARMHRIPMRALNIERSFTREISSNGWSAIPADQRKGIGDPLPPSTAYEDSLKEIFGMHGEDNEQKDKERELSEAEKKRFKGFMEVQTIWDRAMAEAIAEVRTAGGKPLVVAIVGRGHLEYGFGISHQLSDLGINDAAILLPWDKDLACEKLKTGQGVPVADAVFGVEEPAAGEKPPRPMLGVQIENADSQGGKAVKIVKVVKNSVAASSGLQKDDLILEAAGRRMTGTQDLVSTIRRQSPGTWLPLGILRDGNRLDIIAKFPNHTKTPNHQ